MTGHTVLATIALKFGQPENVATEAVLHILHTHTTSAAALAELLTRAGLPALPSLTFRSQVGDTDGAIPDLVGIDTSGDTRLILEAKFWAHLTDHQPVTYLRRLTDSAPSVLLFVCPAARQAALWDLLQSRAKPAMNSSTELTSTIAPGHPIQWMQISQHRCLAILSWQTLLSAIAADAAMRGSRDYEADVEQLNGLCIRVDSDAFLPLRDSELAPDIGRRAAQFADLVDATVRELRADSRVSTKNLTTGGGHGAYCRFFSYGPIIASVLYSPALWSRYQLSPLWLSVTDKSSAPLPGAIDILRRQFTNWPTKVIEHDKYTYVALIPPCGVDFGEAASSLARQSSVVCEALAQVIPDGKL